MKFNAERAYDAMTPEEQRKLGIAATLCAAYWQIEDRLGQGLDAGRLTGEQVRRWCTAESEAMASIQLDTVLSDEEIVDGPNMGAIGVRACSVCGCTDDIACEGGCTWVGPTLCSRCGSAVVDVAEDNPQLEFPVQLDEADKVPVKSVPWDDAFRRGRP